MGQSGRAGFDPGHQLLVVEVILRHRPQPVGHVAEDRLAFDSQKCCHVPDYQGPEFLVRHFRQLRPPCPTHEDPQQDLPFRGTVRVFLTAEAARQDRTIFHGRDDGPHSVQGVGDLLAAEA